MEKQIVQVFLGDPSRMTTNGMYSTGSART